jgi:hypothetical protein
MSDRNLSGISGKWMPVTVVAASVWRDIAPDILSFPVKQIEFGF